jgi:hypothetical protein
LGLRIEHRLRPGRSNEVSAEQLRLAELVGRTAAVIIERKRADDDRARLVAIVELSDDEITGTTLEGIVTSWNAAGTAVWLWREGAHWATHNRHRSGRSA